MHNSQFGWQSPTVVLHTLYPGRYVRLDRSRSPRRQAGQTEEISDTEEDTSLLQVKHVVLRKGMGTDHHWSSSSCEFIQRSEYVQKHPCQFAGPMTWARVASPVMSLPHAFVDVLFPVSSQEDTQQVSVVVELCSVNDMTIGCEGVRVITVSATCDIFDILSACRLHGSGH